MSMNEFDFTLSQCVEQRRWTEIETASDQSEYNGKWKELTLPMLVYTMINTRMT